MGRGNHWIRHIWRAVLVAGALVVLAACGDGGSGGPSGKVTLPVDPTVKPVQPDLPDEEGNPREVARMVSDSGVAMDFVLGELVVATNDTAKLNAMLSRWGGSILSTSPAVGDAPALHRIKLDPSAAQVDALLAEAARDLPELNLNYRTSSQAASKLLAVAISEAKKGGFTVMPNFVLTPSAIADGTTSEAPSGDAGYTPNAFNWTYMNRGSPQDIGVGAAWQALQRADKLDNRVRMLILDGGFSPNNDMPATRQIDRPSVRNSASCSGNRCDWHGTNVTSAAMGIPDNNYGAAGPAGPVGELVAVHMGGDFFATVRSVASAISALAYGNVKIINMSGSFELDLGWDVAIKVLCLGFCLSPTEIADRIAIAVTNSGKLIFAAAGNNGVDVDNGGGIEGSSILPCELSSVICVGGMNANSTLRAANSNFGSKISGGTVDIYGPFTVFVGPDPDNPANVARSINGTSFSSPFVAGVAALVWAANPALSANQVRDILFDTAHVGGLGVTGIQRRVNAFGAVASVLAGSPPTVTVTGLPSVALNRETAFVAQVTDAEYGAGYCPPSTCPLSWSPTPDRVLGNSAYYRFTTPGVATVTVTAQDAAGQTATDSTTISVINSAPVVSISQPLAGSSHAQGVPVQLLGSATDLNEGPDPGPNPIDCRWTSSNPADSAFPRTTCSSTVTFGSPGTRTLTLSASDPQGLSATASVTITITAPPANLPPVITLGSLPPFNYNGDGYDWNTAFAVTASATDPENNTPITFEWRATSYAPGGATSTVYASNVLIATTANLNWIPSSSPSLFNTNCGLPTAYYGQIVRLTLFARDSLGNTSSRSLPDIKVYSCILM